MPFSRKISTRLGPIWRGLGGFPTEAAWAIPREIAGAFKANATGVLVEKELCGYHTDAN